MTKLDASVVRIDLPPDEANVIVVAIMAAVGFAVGFRIDTGPGPFLAGLGIVLLFSHAISWGFAAIGLAAPNSETAQLMSFPILFPLMFASSAFVPVGSMPGWLQLFADNQPITAVVDATRALMLGGPTASHVSAAIAWSLGLLVVLPPLAVRRYRRLD